MAQRPFEKDRPGRLRLLGKPSHDRYRNGRRALLFYLPLYQSHGPIAEPSARGEYDRVYAFASYLPCHFRRGPVYERVQVRPLDMPHEPVVSSRDRTDDPVGFKLHEPLYGEHDVYVAAGVGVVVVVVGDGVLIHRRIGRELPV